MKEFHQRKDTVRINFEFPLKEYPYLKKVCAQRGMTLRDFATMILVRAIEEAEDEFLLSKAKERLEEMDPDDLITFDEATRLAGWDA